MMKTLLIVSFNFFCLSGMAQTSSTNSPARAELASSTAIPPTQATANSFAQMKDSQTKADSPAQIGDSQTTASSPARTEPAQTSSDPVLANFADQNERIILNLDKKIAERKAAAESKPQETLLEPPFPKEPSTLEDSVAGGRFLEFGLEYPINFGIHLRYLASESVYARFGLGFMPSFFLNSFEKLSPSFGYLNEEEAKLISNTFENSMYIDFRMAWSPYLKESGGGPYIELGISRILYGKGELTGSNLNKVIPGGAFDELKTYSAKTNTYNATAHIGYQVPFEKVKLNVEVGLIKILQTDILSEKSLTASTLLNSKQEKSFKNFLKKKGWIFPTISGWISFAF